MAVRNQISSYYKETFSGKKNQKTPISKAVTQAMGETISRNWQDAHQKGAGIPGTSEDSKIQDVFIQS